MRGSEGVHSVPSWPLRYIIYCFCCYCLCFEYTSESAFSIWRCQLRWLNSIVQNFCILTNYLCLLAVSVMERNLLKPTATFCQFLLNESWSSVFRCMHIYCHQVFFFRFPLLLLCIVPLFPVTLFVLKFIFGMLFFYFTFPVSLLSVCRVSLYFTLLLVNKI